MKDEGTEWRCPTCYHLHETKPFHVEQEELKKELLAFAKTLTDKDQATRIYDSIARHF